MTLEMTAILQRQMAISDQYAEKCELLSAELALQDEAILSLVCPICHYRPYEHTTGQLKLALKRAKARHDAALAAKEKPS